MLSWLSLRLNINLKDLGDATIGKENVVWAPNRIAGQHNISALENDVNQLKAVDAAGADLDDIRIKGETKMDKTKIAKDIRGAIKNGQLDILKDLLEKEPEMLTWMTPFGSWLHVAAAHGQLEIIEFLINVGIDVNAQGGTFSTNALERAATRGYLDIVEYLINHNIEFDTSEPDRNPLFAAIYGGNFEIVKLLVKNNIDIFIKYSGENMKDMDAYAFAIKRGELKIAEYLKQQMDQQK